MIVYIINFICWQFWRGIIEEIAVQVLEDFTGFGLNREDSRSHPSFPYVLHLQQVRFVDLTVVTMKPF
jgi:hypothetical protein